MEIAKKITNREFGCVIPDSCNPEAEINNNRIPHRRARNPNEPLKEDDHAILRSELGILVRVPLVAPPGAIYDESAAAQTFSDGGFFYIFGDVVEF